MSKRFVKIHPADNVLVALADLQPGEQLVDDGVGLKVVDFVPAKHKILTRPLNTNEEVIMYGVTVGKALKPIPAGGVITTSNIAHLASEFSEKKKTLTWNAPDVSKYRNRTFDGYHRSDGQVGTANYWLVVPLVFCENRNVDVMREAFETELGFVSPGKFRNYVKDLVQLYRKGDTAALQSFSSFENSLEERPRVFENIDGIKFINHQGGCGGTRQDAESLVALIAGYIHNPNVAGATVLSLGCQNAQAAMLQTRLEKLNPSFSKPLIILEQQKEGTEQLLLTRAIHQTFLGLVEANKQKRQPAPLSRLVVGLECGGSDGFSGISANPAIGHTSDLVAALGGTSILSEFPELCGVEQELINRCIDESTANRFIQLMRVYEARANAVGSGFDMNPSPGNIKDGLITDAIKSAGAAKKGGTSPVTDVIDYGEYVKRPGLNLQCTPGNDVESTTAMAGAGANIILFTTGLGTPTGNPITPVVKISSNTKLARQMPDIIDVDSGAIIAGEKSIEQLGEEILEYVIEVASGRTKTKAVQLNQNDFIPWKRGVSL